MNINLEALVDMMLDGRGAEVMSLQIEDPDLQEFQLRVPAYMAKIRLIHKASTSGRLRDLQALIDREKLALAKDDLGRSPLHLAVLYNHDKMARYLASTYPQSLKSLDNEGRSALHYAATLPDFGNLYDYLVNLGADPNVKDSVGNTPGAYLQNHPTTSGHLGYNASVEEITAVAAIETATRVENINNQQPAPMVKHLELEHPETPESSSIVSKLCKLCFCQSNNRVNSSSSDRRRARPRSRVPGPK